MAIDPLRGFVVFHEHGAWLPWLMHWQHPTIRHCFAIVVADDLLLSIDGINGVLDNTCVGAAKDLEYMQEFFSKSCGWIVVPFTADRVPVMWPMCWATCVGMVKLMLSLNKPLILTPYQLFRYLTETLDLEVYKP
jgi:hypothetical protein